MWRIGAQHRGNVNSAHQYCLMISEMHRHPHMGFTEEQKAQRELAINNSPLGLLKEYGREYGERRAWRKMYKIKQCYRNAYMLACKRGWTYCEGYATRYISTEHAWCIDNDGRVVDPTWSDKLHTGETVTPDYFGIAFDWEFHQEIMLKTQTHSIFAAWWKWESIIPRVREYLEARQEKNACITTTIG